MRKYFFLLRQMQRQKKRSYITLHIKSAKSFKRRKKKPVSFSTFSSLCNVCMSVIFPRRRGGRGGGGKGERGKLHVSLLALDALFISFPPGENFFFFWIGFYDFYSLCIS